MNGDEWLI